MFPAHLEHAQHRRRGTLRAMRQDRKEQVVSSPTQGIRGHSNNI
jgi:hypothetical protein